MDRSSKNTGLIGDLTLFFGVFLLFTDVFFLIMGIVFDMPVMRYVIYVKLVVNSANIFLILKKHYLISTAIIYTVIIGFMVTGVICMGTGSAFQLYALGMLPCISYNGYLHNRILKKELPLVPMIAIHVLFYAASYIYARTHEPLYTVPRIAEDIMIVFNSIATFSIMIIYVCFFYKVAIRSEEKLEKMALIDNLTGLYNRHYVLTSLEQMRINTSDERWIALLDIDDFKKVNDTYGHNCGDYILHRVAELAQQICKDCIVCRWGGEEFLILSAKHDCRTELLETLRKKIADEEFRFEKDVLHITVTIGAAQYNSNVTNDGWISAADEKLYSGKNSGKNKVVI